jgi:hypothetical protein
MICVEFLSRRYRYIQSSRTVRCETPLNTVDDDDDDDFIYPDPSPQR